MASKSVGKFTFHDIKILIDELQLEGKKQKIAQKVKKILEWHQGEKPPFDTAQLSLLGVELSFRKRFEPEKDMMYRDYLGVHLLRVGQLVDNGKFIISAFFGKEVALKSYTQAYYHDVGELASVFGDVPTHKKRELSKTSLELLSEVEKQCMLIMGSANIDELGWFQSIHTDRNEFQKMVQDTFDKSQLQTQIVSYYDKIDGLMCAFHELAAGNTSFTKVVLYYIGIFKKIAAGRELPALQPLFQLAQKEYQNSIAQVCAPDGKGVVNYYSLAGHFFDIQSILELENILPQLPQEKQPHTSESLDSDFGFPMYQNWKGVILSLGMKKRDLRIEGKTIAPEELLTKIRN